MYKLSIIIPVYNEKDTLLKVLKKVEDVKLPGFEKEIILVDDYSQDGTREILKELEQKHKVFYHLINQGKGAALRTGFKQISGDFVIIQDADLEYDPADYPAMLEPLVQDKADIVYGSRNLKKNPRFKKSYYWGVLVISWLTNILYGSKLTDVYTCYKAFKAPILKDMNLTSRGFEFEQEVTVKALKKNYRILEIPINYYPRSFNQGKKIHWLDGLKAIITMLRYKV